MDESILAKSGSTSPKREFRNNQFLKFLILLGYLVNCEFGIVAPPEALPTTLFLTI
jgi:hypothetical protein